jgi:hypothetical protein
MNQLRTPDTSPFASWVAYFTANLARHDRLDAHIPWDSNLTLPKEHADAIARSLQRFELGESGDGIGLLGKARRVAGADQCAALVLLVAEEQKHSALFGAALQRFGTERLTSHWSDAAFVRLRRLLGLRTEVTLFLIAETVALEYFAALARCGDLAVQGVAQRILTDEVEHIRFQVDQLRAAFDGVPRSRRMLAATAAWVVAVGAATVLAVDHAPALRACGLRPITFWHRALRQFGLAAPHAFRLGRREWRSGPIGRPSEVPARTTAAGRGVRG